MFFFQRENAARFIEDFTAKLRAGKCRIFVDGEVDGIKCVEPAPWRFASEAPVDGWWTRMCIDEVNPTDGGPKGFEVLLETWPNGSLRNPNLKHRHQRITHMEEDLREGVVKP